MPVGRTLKEWSHNKNLPLFFGLPFFVVCVLWWCKGVGWVGCFLEACSRKKGSYFVLTYRFLIYSNFKFKHFGLQLFHDPVFLEMSWFREAHPWLWDETANGRKSQKRGTCDKCDKKKKGGRREYLKKKQWMSGIGSRNMRKPFVFAIKEIIIYNCTK